MQEKAKRFRQLLRRWRANNERTLLAQEEAIEEMRTQLTKLKKSDEKSSPEKDTEESEDQSTESSEEDVEEQERKIEWLEKIEKTEKELEQLAKNIKEAKKENEKLKKYTGELVDQSSTEALEKNPDELKKLLFWLEENQQQSNSTSNMVCVQPSLSSNISLSLSLQSLILWYHLQS